MMATMQRWWGDFVLAEGKWARFEIGPLSLFARRVPGEWRFAWRSGDRTAKTVTVDLDIGNDPDTSGRTLGRFAMRDPGKALRIMPRLADRAVVVRTETPLYLLAHEKTTLYVSTPVWITLSTTSESTGMLTEIPSLQPSETWFGANTLRGESCYAVKTSARTDVAQLAALPHLAVTPIQIRNTGVDNLTIEQLRVPAANLTLYAAPDGRLWTDTVHFERSAGERAATLRIGDNYETGAGDKTRMAGPRVPHEARSMVQAFSRFFG